MDVSLIGFQIFKIKIVLHYTLGILKCTVEFVWRANRGNNVAEIS